MTGGYKKDGTHTTNQQEEMKMEQITVNVRNVYGRQLVYPVCERAKAFARIKHKKTLTDEMIKEIKFLGYELVVMPEKLGEI